VEGGSIQLRELFALSVGESLVPSLNNVTSTF
jgi:hypothetical protein